MPRMSKAEKQLEKDIHQYFKKHAQGIQIPVMDLSKITQDAKNAHKNNQNVEQAVVDAINKYRVN